MKALVLQENLQKALSFVGKNISTRVQLPILSQVLVKTEEGKINLSSTNLENSITFGIGAVIEEDGSIAVPARIFAELVSSFGQDKVELVTDKNTLKLSCGGSEATLSGMDAGEFPPLPEAGNKKDATFSKELLEKNLPLLLISASIDEGRPILTGIRFKAEKKTLVIAATDGYRLSVKKLEEDLGIKDGLVVPAKALAEGYRALNETKADGLDLYTAKDANQIIFSLPDINIATRLIEGEYPQYEKIIPSSFATRVIFNKEQLLKSIKFAAVYAKESANIVRLNIASGEVIVSANTPQVGENKTRLEAKTEGDGGEIAFNVRFLLDLLSVYSEEEIAFEMTGPLAPGVFKFPQNESFLHIIMPVRVQG